MAMMRLPPSVSTSRKAPEGMCSIRLVAQYRPIT
jgi:hypothetical protein